VFLFAVQLILVSEDAEVVSASGTLKIYIPLLRINRKSYCPHQPAQDRGGTGRLHEGRHWMFPITNSNGSTTKFEVNQHSLWLIETRSTESWEFELRSINRQPKDNDANN
jgi:hypothetical protein